MTARDVVAFELQPPSNRLVHVEGPTGIRCRSTRPLRCRLGDLGPHERITLHATVRTSLTGRVVNRVAVVTATPETRLIDNRALAVLHVESWAARRLRGAAAALLIGSAPGTDQPRFVGQHDRLHAVAEVELREH